MFCSSDNWDSAICRPESCSRPVDMEAFYFLYSPFPLFKGVRGSGVLRTSPRRSSRKVAFFRVIYFVSLPVKLVRELSIFASSAGVLRLLAKNTSRE